MVKIRLSRRGAKGHAFYRIVAIDERRPTQGRALELLGTYDPNQKPERLVLRADRLEDWVRKGAQLTPTVKSLVRRAKRHAGAGAA
jgi:small subunit ribosomal protein S16